MKRLLLVALLCLLIGSLPSSSYSEEVRFDYPKPKGVLLDWCLLGGTQCGKEAADNFCAYKGYEKAAAWKQYPKAGFTLLLQPMVTCSEPNQPRCDSFTYIVCTGDKRKKIHELTISDEDVKSVADLVKKLQEYSSIEKLTIKLHGTTKGGLAFKDGNVDFRLSQIINENINNFSDRKPEINTINFENCVVGLAPGEMFNFGKFFNASTVTGWTKYLVDGKENIQIDQNDSNDVLQQKVNRFAGLYLKGTPEISKLKPGDNPFDLRWFIDDPPEFDDLGNAKPVATAINDPKKGLPKNIYTLSQKNDVKINSYKDAATYVMSVSVHTQQFNLDTNSFIKLREEGVPEDIINKLKGCDPNKKYFANPAGQPEHDAGEKEFLEDVRKAINNPVDFEEFKSRIWNATTSDSIEVKQNFTPGHDPEHRKGLLYGLPLSYIIVNIR